MDQPQNSLDNTPFLNVNWTATSLYVKYENKESTNFEVSDQHFSCDEINEALEKFRVDT